jgi:hypothetical protein
MATPIRKDRRGEAPEMAAISDRKAGWCGQEQILERTTAGLSINIARIFSNGARHR